MLAAAKPWTYWMALPLLVSSVLALAAFGYVYLTKVVEPNLRRLDALAAARAATTLAGGGVRGALGCGAVAPRQDTGAPRPAATVGARSR